MPDTIGTAIGGQQFRGYQRGATTASGADQYVVPVYDRVTSFAGRAASFRIPGTGTAATQILATLHNATGSAVLVNLNRIIVGMTSTAAKVVAPPVCRVYRITVLPTAGTAMNKVGFDTTATSSASVTVLGGASADGTASAITATVPTTTRLAQWQASRALTLVGVDQAEPFIFFEGTSDVVLRALEGVAVIVENVAATTTNPTTDLWTVEFDFEEFTRP